MTVDESEHLSAHGSERSSTRLSVLGPLRAERSGASVVLGGPKQRQVLALLIAGRGQPVSQDALAASLYGLWSDRRMVRTVQTYVSNLRAVLPGSIARTDAGYQLRSDLHSVDADDFAASVTQGLERIVSDPAAAARRLSTGLRLWRGDAYEGLEGNGHLEAERVRLEQLKLLAISGRMEAGLALGQHRLLIGELAALTVAHPYREDFVAYLMMAFHSAGLRCQALATYRTAHETITSELGVEPSHWLVHLHRQIAADRLGSGVRLDCVRESLRATQYL